MAHDYSMQFHGFYVDVEEKRMSFDVVLSFDCDTNAAIKEIYEEIKEMYPDYTIFVQHDIDITE